VFQLSPADLTVRNLKVRTWDDLPWAGHRVTVIYPQRRVRCRACGIRTERVAFVEPKARITRRLQRVIGLDCQSMPTSHAAVRHGVSWSKARRAKRAFLTAWDASRPRRRPQHLGADEIHRGNGNNHVSEPDNPRSADNARTADRRRTAPESASRRSGLDQGRALRANAHREVAAILRGASARDLRFSWTR
jgi:transposase